MRFDRNILKNLFSYTKSEIRGILVLLLLLIVMLVIRYLLEGKDQFPEIVVETLPEMPQPTAKKSGDIEIKDLPQTGDEFHFKENIDPNKATFSELKEFGFSDFSAENLIKYRKSGAVYAHWTDLLRIYGIDSLFLVKAKPYLVFNTVNPPATGIRKTEVQISIVELNSADTAKLKTLPGIGEVLSQRIVKYRDLLGGFYSAEQLVEVYGISDSLVTFLASQVNVDTSNLQKIYLNRATLEELQNHPYISRYQAKAIMSYRKLAGNFTTYKSLTDNYLLPEEVFAKLTPYLSIE